MRFRLAAILGLLIIALAIVLAIVLTPAQRPVARESPPPASLIDIGGRKLHLYCTGPESPTVILMAGGGAFSIDRALVQPKVGENARVCSYDGGLTIIRAAIRISTRPWGRRALRGARGCSTR
jgi:hypothetical protein